LIFRNDYIKRLASGTQATGLEVIFIADGGVLLNYVSVKKRGRVISVLNSERYDSINEFAKAANRRFPVYLSFDGKGILHRNNFPTDGRADVRDWSGPVNNPDVMEQSVELVNGDQIRSYTRRDRVDEVTVQLSEHGFMVLETILGPFACSAIAESGNEEATIRTAYYDMVFSDRRLVSMSKSDSVNVESVFAVDNRDISLNYLVAFSNSLCHFTGFFDEAPDNPKLILTREGYTYKSLIERGKIPFLAGCFVILLVNYVVFDHYRSANMGMRNEIARNSAEIEGYEKLSALLNQRDQYYSSTGFHERSMISFLSDRLAGKLPEGVKLKRLTFFPESKRIPGSSAISYQNGIIHISGNTFSGISIHNLMTALKEFNWVDDVKMLGYTDSGQGIADFVIQVNISIK
jgi:Tfp pilus assembly protein PilN